MSRGTIGPWALSNLALFEKSVDTPGLKSVLQEMQLQTSVLKSGCYESLIKLQQIQPEHLEETHADMERTCRLHTERSYPRWVSLPGPS